MGRIQVSAQTHFRTCPDHREVVGPFLAGFDVTRAYTPGKESLAAFFLKPERNMADFLGIERELLLVYSPHRDFQIRTLTIHDEILAANRDRLDPLGSVIVADAPDVRDFLGHALGKEEQRAPIVALAREELVRIGSLNDLRRAFAKQFYRRDLFGYESPLTRDTLFFDRQETVTAIIDRFRSRQNSGLFGLRRIGKTSVLFAVQRRCIAERIGTALYMDLSLPHRWKLSWRDLLRTIVREAVDLIPRAAVATSEVWAYKKLYSEEQASWRFKADIKYLCGLVPGGRILVALDEVENITPGLSPEPRWNDEYLPFWQTMRAVHQESHGAFCFVVVGVNPHLLEVQRIGQTDNPLFSTVRTDYLPPFDHRAVREMVRRLGRSSGITIDEAVYTALDADFGGHPYLIRQACSRLVQDLPERPATITDALYQEKRDSVRRALEANVRQILTVLEAFYPDEYEAVRQLATGDRSAFLRAVVDQTLFAQHVEGYGLVANASTETPSIRIGVVREHLAKVTAPSRRAEADASDDEAIRAEIGRRRNGIEPALRRYLADALYVHYGAGAASRTLKCLSEQRRDRLQPFSYDEMWNQMYLSDLSQIIRSEWEKVGAVFRPHEKDRVLMWLEHMTAMRTDAHAGTLSEDDLALLRVAFRRFEDALARWRDR